MPITRYVCQFLPVETAEDICTAIGILKYWNRPRSADGNFWNCRYNTKDIVRRWKLICRRPAAKLTINRQLAVRQPGSKNRFSGNFTEIHRINIHPLTSDLSPSLCYLPGGPHGEHGRCSLHSKSSFLSYWLGLSWTDEMSRQLLYFIILAFFSWTCDAFSNPIKTTDGSDPFMVYHEGYYYLTSKYANNVFCRITSRYIFSDNLDEHPNHSRYSQWTDHILYASVTDSYFELKGHARSEDCDSQGRLDRYDSLSLLQCLSVYTKLILLLRLTNLITMQGLLRSTGKLLKVLGTCASLVTINNNIIDDRIIS